MKRTKKYAEGGDIFAPAPAYPTSPAQTPAPAPAPMSPTRYSAIGDPMQATAIGAPAIGMKCGGKVKNYARGGGVESKGKTKGRFV